MTVFHDDGQVVMHHGDVREVLAAMPAESVHMVVTSPPYWGLRDYGTATWDGGDAGCDHFMPVSYKSSTLGASTGGRSVETHARSIGAQATPYAHTCGKCGARRIDQQLGLEATPTEFVAAMVDVFREVRRVLRDDGTCWVNMGGGYQDKQMDGMPWRLAFALQADGWYLRQDIIWAKPNPMPESVTSRCTKSHEYLFLLSKSSRYYFDATAIREAAVRAGDTPGGNNERGAGVFGVAPHVAFNGTVPSARNKRSVWTIATAPYAEAHFATFPQALVRPCILAGTSEHGVCADCGAPWARVTEVDYEHVNNTSPREHSSYIASAGAVANKRVTTTGWAPTCTHEAPVVPARVLDPFLGSGTTALVAKALGRHAVGIDLSAEYLGMAAKRCAQMGMAL